MSPYLLTWPAAADLRAIVSYVQEQDGVDRALHVYDALVRGFEFVASSPNAGFQKRHADLGVVRWWPVFSFLIVYDPTTSPVEILRISHAAQDFFSGVDQ